MSFCGVKEPTVKYLQTEAEPEPPAPGRTSQYYRVKPGVPERFEHPGCFQGYGRVRRDFLKASKERWWSFWPALVCAVPQSYRLISPSHCSAANSCLLASRHRDHKVDHLCHHVGNRSRTTNPLYRTTNQTYGSQQPTVHEMPTSFFSVSQKLSEHLSKCGMYKDNGLNVGMEKSLVTGPENLITFQDRLNFHRSYHEAGPSYTD